MSPRVESPHHGTSKGKLCTTWSLGSTLSGGGAAEGVGKCYFAFMQDWNFLPDREPGFRP